MDIQKYIKSGVLEAYCLGLLDDEEQAYLIQMTMLYPEVKEELTAIELALEEFADRTAIEPDAVLKQKILASLDLDETDSLSLERLPVISHAADPQPWLKVLGDLIPAEPADDFICHVIREDDQVKQMLVISKINVDEEEHSDFLESFFILKGRCECTIGENFYSLAPGDFIDIPLHTPHNIKLLTPVVIAVLQYKFM